MEKIDLKEFSFLIPLRIESKYRLENISTLISIFNQYFESSIIILEADTEQRFNPLFFSKNIQYRFVYDPDEVFHRTKYINQLLQISKTKYVGVWDTDAIVYPLQIAEAYNLLIESKAIMSFPYSGKFLALDKSLSSIFHKTLNFDHLRRIEDILPLMYGYNSVGGCFMVNRDVYIGIGGENEQIYGWGPEDIERVKRVQKKNLPIYRVSGVLFHLWHPIGVNSQPANLKIKIKNTKELLRTCLTE